MEQTKSLDSTEPSDSSQINKTELVHPPELETQLLKELLAGFLAKSQAEIAIRVVWLLKTQGCYSRSGKQMFVTDIKMDAPRATLYRVVSELEKHGFLDRESKYSGYFLSYNYANWLENKASKWRKFAKFGGDKQK